MEDKRKNKGLTIASEYDGVTIVIPHKLYHVRSQSNHNNRYIVHLDPKAGHLGAGDCTCYDHKHSHNRCKHLYAAAAWQLALDYAPILSAERNLTLDQFEDNLVYQLCQPMPEPHATKILIMFHATQQLLSSNDGTTIIELNDHREMIGKYCRGHIDRYQHDAVNTAGILDRFRHNCAEMAKYTIGQRTYYHFA